MPLTTCAVTVQAHDPGGPPLPAGTPIIATLSQPESDGGVIVPERVTAMLAADGTCTLPLWPNARGSGASHYTVQIGHLTVLHAHIPDLPAVSLHTCLIDGHSALPITGPVRTVNGTAPDAAGNVVIDGIGTGTVQSVNGVEPDDAGNIDLLAPASPVAQALAELEQIAIAPGAALCYAMELLTDEERTQVRDADTIPTINVGAKLQAWLDAAYALYGDVPNRKGGQGARLLLHPGLWLVDGLQLRPGQSLIGLASRYEVRVIQSNTARQPLIDILGRASGTEDAQRRTDVYLQDLLLKCNGNKTLEGEPINGIHLRTEDGVTDEVNRTGVIAHRVQCVDSSGTGFYSKKRGRNWLHECQFTGHAEEGVFIQGPDCLLIKVFCGETGKTPLHFLSCGTPMIDHVELGTSRKPQQYPSLHIEACADYVISNGNCTGWMLIEGGEDDPTHELYGVSQRGTVANVIFTFKDKSFQDDADVFYDLNGYIVVKNAKGPAVRGCHFRPAELRITDGITGAVSYQYTRRPLSIVHIQGAGSSGMSFDCPLPALTDPLWPAGTPSTWPGSVPANSYDSITNKPDQALIFFTDPSPAASAWVANRLRLMDGLQGQRATQAPVAGTVGEITRTETPAPVTLPPGAVTSLGSITLQPGHWDIRGTVVFTGADVTAYSVAVGVAGDATSINASSPRRYATAPLAVGHYSGPLATLQVGPHELRNPSAATRYLNATAQYGAGSVTASGVIEARRAR